MSSPKTLVTPLASAMFVVACGSDPAPPPKPPKPVPTVEAKPAKNDEDVELAKAGPSSVNVDERIVKMCNLPTSRFDFDSASVGASAAQVLDAVAQCFTEGPAKGKKMNLVGHADPRGETMYNYGLGQRRAAAISRYLKDKGLDDDRMETSSRGELEATGTDEESWARDRRVQIFLAE